MKMRQHDVTAPVADAAAMRFPSEQPLLCCLWLTRCCRAHARLPGGSFVKFIRPPASAQMAASALSSAASTRFELFSRTTRPHDVERRGGKPPAPPCSGKGTGKRLHRMIAIDRSGRLPMGRRAIGAIAAAIAIAIATNARSEERRVGKEGKARRAPEDL